MKKNLKKVVLVLALLLPGVIKAQEFNVTAKADFVSDYIWRCAYQNSGFSVQPTLGLSYGNLSLSAWGSQSLTKTDGAQDVYKRQKLTPKTCGDKTNRKKRLNHRAGKG